MNNSILDKNEDEIKVYCAFCAKPMGMVSKKQKSELHAYQLRKLVQDHACYKTEPQDSTDMIE